MVIIRYWQGLKITLLINLFFMKNVNFIDYIIEKISNLSNKYKYFQIIAFFIIISPILTTALFGMYLSNKEGVRTASNGRKEIASFAAQNISSNFDRLVSIGISQTTRQLVIEYIKQDKWREAANLLSNVPNNFIDIERIFLTNKAGVEMADYPELSGVVGVDFSGRDWYRGVSRNWQPYVSGVYRRAALPQYNVLAIALPVKNEKQEVLAILVIQVKTESLMDWAPSSLSGSGFIYITDQYGNIAYHPKYPTQGDVVSYADVPTVKKALSGQGGIEVAYNQIENTERLSAYHPVPKYNWTVVYTEPLSTVFMVKNMELTYLGLIYGIILIFGCFVIFIVLRSLDLLFNSKELQKIYLESIGDGVVAIDRYWNIILWNKAAANLTGWTKEEAIGRNFRDVLKIYRESDRQENIAFIEEAILYGRTGFMQNHTFLIRKDEKEMPIGDSAAPIFDRSGRVTGAIIIFRDVTEEKETMSFRSDFAYASHQFNTPTTKTLWLLESAMEETDLLKVKEKIKIAHKSALSIQKLSSQLLAISEIDQKVIIPQMENFKLTDLFEKILRNFDGGIKLAGIKMEVSPISAIAGIKTDQKLFNGAMFEIIDNAYKYNKPNGQISVKIEIQDRGILVTVSDTGIGILEDQQSLIFTKFFRGNNFDTTEIIGAGLGLFTAKEYIQLLNGKIWFRSESGKGSTFFVQIPLA